MNATAKKQPAADAPAPESAAQAAPEANPQSGGSYTREADGSLTKNKPRIAAPKTPATEE